MPLPKRDFLYQLEHPTTKVVMTFDAWGPGSDNDFARPGNTYVIPGANSPVDANGDAANPVSSRVYTFRFLRPYKTKDDGTLETYTEAMDDFRRMVVHGKRMTAVQKTTKGTLRYGRFKLLGLNIQPNQDDDVAAIFNATFDMTPAYWQNLNPTNATLYDATDMIYDVGDNYYDDDGYHLNANSQDIFIDNTEATLPDYGATFALYGIYGGDLGCKITNKSVDPPVSITINQRINTNQMIVIESSTEAVRLNSIPRPDLMTLPRGQFDVFLIEAGIVNRITIECLGANPQHGGYLTVDTLPKFV